MSVAITLALYSSDLVTLPGFVYVLLVSLLVVSDSISYYFNLHHYKSLSFSSEGLCIMLTEETSFNASLQYHLHNETIAKWHRRNAQKFYLLC